MKKVVIIGSGTHGDNGLFGLLNDLFPECEVRVVPSGTELAHGGLMGFRREEAPSEALLGRSRDRALCGSGIDQGEKGRSPWHSFETARSG